MKADEWAVRMSAARRRPQRMRSHVAASFVALSAAVALAGLASALVQVESVAPPRLSSRLLMEPSAGADWDASWTSVMQDARLYQVASLNNVGLVLLVLLVVAVVVAVTSFVALTLGAASARRRELATRAALGATPAQLLLALGGEAVTVTMAALPAGWCGGLAAVQIAERAWPAHVFSAGLVEQGLRIAVVGALAALLALLLAVAISYAAVLRRPLAPALTGGARVTASPAELQLRDALAVLQLAGVLVLLSGAAGLARDSRPERGGDSLAQPSLRIARLQLTGSAFDDPRARAEYLRELLGRLHEVPGVAAETLASAGTWLGVSNIDRVVVDCGNCYQATMYTPFKGPSVRHYAVAPGFFDTLGLQIFEGRDFTMDDGAGAERVVLVNRPLATNYFKQGKPIGRAAQPYGPLSPERVIVGVVPVVRSPLLGGAARLDPALYLPLLQHPARTVDVLVRIADEAIALPALERLRAAAAPATIGVFEPADVLVGRLGAPLRFLAAALLGLSAIITLLGVHGAYALQRFRVENLQREVGVRLAIGATPRAVGALVLTHTAKLVLAATLIGMFGALAAMRGLQLLLPSAPRASALVFLLVAVLLAIAALAGAYAPARRASMLQPAVALGE